MTTAIVEKQFITMEELEIEAVREEKKAVKIIAGLPSDVVNIINGFRPYHGIHNELIRELMYRAADQIYRVFNKIGDYTGVHHIDIRMHFNEPDMLEIVDIPVYDVNNLLDVRDMNEFHPKFDQYVHMIEMKADDLIAENGKCDMDIIDQAVFEYNRIPDHITITIYHEMFIGNFDECDWSEYRELDVDCICGSAKSYVTNDSPSVQVILQRSNCYSRETSFCCG